MTDMNKERPQVKATVQIENDRIKVIECRFVPGAETGWHRHGYDYAVVPLTSGNLLLETDEGESIAELTSGQPYFRNVGVEHNVINANDYEFVFIEIELK